MGRDLYAKMGVQISFSANESVQLKLTGLLSSLIMTLAIRREEWCLYSSPPGGWTFPPELETGYPLVWAEENPLGLTKHHAPILIDLKPGAHPVKLQQCPIPQEAQLRMQAHLDRLLQQGLLMKCQSPWSTVTACEEARGA